MLQLLEKVIELENWTAGKGVIVRGAKNTFSSGSDLNAVKALATPEVRPCGLHCLKVRRPSRSLGYRVSVLPMCLLA